MRQSRLHAFVCIHFLILTIWETILPVQSFKTPVRIQYKNLVSLIPFEKEDIEVDGKLDQEKKMQQIKSENQAPEGYLSSDFSSIGDSKQIRVFIYIAFSLIPCLFLIPFFMSRDFVPPIDPEAFK